MYQPLRQGLLLNLKIKVLARLVSSINMCLFLSFLYVWVTSIHGHVLLFFIYFLFLFIFYLLHLGPCVGRKKHFYILCNHPSPHF